MFQMALPVRTGEGGQTRQAAGVALPGHGEPSVWVQSPLPTPRQFPQEHLGHSSVLPVLSLHLEQGHDFGGGVL